MGTAKRARRVGAWLAVGTAAWVVLSGCSGTGRGGPVAAETDAATTTTAPAPSGAATGAPSAATPDGGGKSSSGSSGSGSTGQALPFAADTRPDTSTVREGHPVLVSVTKGDHDGYVRHVFRFRHADPEGHQPWRTDARPAWDVRWVPRGEAVMDGSGEPVANSGARAHLRIRFQADMHDADGRSTLERSVSDDGVLVFGGDFEGQVTWFYGAGQQRPFRVFYAGEGKVAVDVVD